MLVNTYSTKAFPAGVWIAEARFSNWNEILWSLSQAGGCRYCKNNVELSCIFAVEWNFYLGALSAFY